MKLKALLFAGLLVAGMSIGLVACGQANKASVSASNSGSSATQGTSSSEAIRIGVPDDGTNLSRGIKLLEAAGLITVDPGAGYAPELKDITGALYNVEVVPLSADSLPSTLGDFGASAINGNYAIPNNLIPSRDGLIIEKQSEGGDNPYVNVIAARTADAGSETFRKIVAAYQTQLVAEFMLVDYKEIYYPAFAYDNDIELTA